MYLRLAIVAVVLVVLSATHWKAYHTGFKVSQAEAQQKELQAQQAVLQAEQAARAKEQLLVSERQKLEERYAREKSKAAAAVAGAESELGRLRDELAAGANRGSACPSAPASSGDYGGARLESELLGNCAQTLVGLAAEADRLEAQVVGLQQYIKGVCLKR
jgi:hypothetical protein